MKQTFKIALSGLLIAIGVVLPGVFHFIPNAGSVILPMHIPVLLAGAVLGPLYGLVIGILTPLISMITTGMPSTTFLPVMMIELAAYGLLIGLSVNIFKGLSIVPRIIISLVLSMIVGRIVYAIAFVMIMNIQNYSIAIWFNSLFVEAIPGIILQIILVPSVVVALQKAKLIKI